MVKKQKNLFRNIFISIFLILIVLRYLFKTSESFSTCINIAPIQNGTSGEVPLISNIFGDGNRLITWRPKGGKWIIKGPGNKNWADSTGNIEIQNGVKGDVPLIANIFGDEKRLIVWRPSQGKWHIKGPGIKNWTNSTGNVSVSFGQNGDVPLIANMFGDGPRLIVWRPSNGTWYIKGLLNASGANITTDIPPIQNGISGDVPLIYDIFGDGPRLITWRPSNGIWYIKGPGNNNWANSNGNQTIHWGAKDDVPLVLKQTLIIWRPSNGTWYIKNISNGIGNTFSWGEKGDIPMVRTLFGDADNDGDANRFIRWRPSNGTWYFYCG
jgi:hypothetical protein